VVCSCGKSIDTRPEWAGCYIRCESCTSKLYVPHAELPPAEAERRPCPFCAEPIRKEAVKCRWCGQSLVLGRAALRTSVAPRVDSGGTGILVLGILGIVPLFGCMSLVFGLIAWSLGVSHESKCRAARIEPSGAAKTGKIMGMISTIVYGALFVLFVALSIAGGNA
jgi:hypothetical protein